MARYTPEFLAAARHGYENTDQPMRELARALGIGITTLSTLAENNGWAKRSQRKRGLPPAMQLLAEAQALTQQSQKELGPRFRGDERSESEPHPARLGEERLAPQDDGAKAAPPSPPEPADLLIKLEHILAQLIAAQQLAPANGIHSPQSARNLATLIQAMRALQGMRGGAISDTGPLDDDDDDMPRDIDEFRRDLARRIDAFVASRTDAANAEGDSSPAPVEKVR